MSHQHQTCVLMCSQYYRDCPSPPAMFPLLSFSLFPLPRPLYFLPLCPAFSSLQLFPFFSPLLLPITALVISCQLPVNHFHINYLGICFGIGFREKFATSNSNIYKFIYFVRQHLTIQSWQVWNSLYRQMMLALTSEICLPLPPKF